MGKRNRNKKLKKKKTTVKNKTDSDHHINNDKKKKQVPKKLSWIMLFQNSYIGFNNNWIMPWNYFCAVTFTNHFPRWLYSLNSCEYSARHFSLLPKKNLPARRSDSSGDAFVRSSSSHRKRFSCTPWMKNAFRYRCQKNNQFQRIIFFRMRMGKNEWINGKWKTKSYGSGFTMWQFLS